MLSELQHSTSAKLHQMLIKHQVVAHIPKDAGLIVGYLGPLIL